jgi:hypothetical protein
VSSLLSFSLFKLCRGTGRNWSVLAFRFAALPSPPIPRPPQTPTLAVIGLARGQISVSRQIRSTKKIASRQIPVDKTKMQVDFFFVDNLDSVEKFVFADSKEKKEN